jgi:hypothetical protein
MTRDEDLHALITFVLNLKELTMQTAVCMAFEIRQKFIGGIIALNLGGRTLMLFQESNSVAPRPHAASSKHLI